MKDNIKKELYSRKIVIIIVLTLFFLGVLFGSIYITILDNDNKKEIINSVNNYFVGYKNISFSNKLIIFKESLLKNSMYYILMWALGLSIIGIPVILLMIFFKAFIFGFSIGSIFACFKFKGIVGILIYIIPSYIIFLILSIFLGIYSVNMSIKLLTNALSKKTLNFGTFMGKYFFILLIIILVIIFNSVFDAFISPIFYKLFNNML